MANNSIFGTLVNIVANLVGAGLLSLPATLMQAGLGERGQFFGLAARPRSCM